MKKTIGIITLLLIANLAISQNLQQLKRAQDPTVLGFDTKRLSRIDTLLSTFVKDGTIPNAVAMIIKDGQIVYSGAYGYKNKEENESISATDIFRNASQTKAITSALLLTYFEENKFALDDPIEKYLPMFSKPVIYVSGSAEAGNLETRPAEKKITIRHLLTHTSGYSYEPRGQKVEGFAYREPTPSGEVLERMSKIPLEHEPGAKFTYGFSTDIAGYLAEVIGGKPLDILMKERIFEPLGMVDSYFKIPKEKQSRLVKLYAREKDDADYSPNPDPFAQEYPLKDNHLALCGGGGLSGTIEDYAKFCLMILNGGKFNSQQILGKKTVELMCSNQMKDIPSNHPFSLAFELTNEARYQQSMVTVGSLKWGGAFGTDYIIDTKENMIMLLYTSIPQAKNVEVHEKFHRAVYQSLIK